MKHTVLLIIGGGIAAYKCLELIRRGGERGIAFRCVMTRAASHFVTELAVASLSGEKVFTELFSLTDEAEMGHIRLSREADLVVVAPATADLMAKAAGGLANDLASTVLLATDKPVLMAPAMNPMMWQHPATRRNVDRLIADGVAMVGPGSGDMACGETGDGRMAEPMDILAAIEALLAPAKAGPLAGRHAIVTSGPTHEPIDPVRYIANRSSGRQGHAIAAALARAGARVTLVSGPVALPDPPGVTTVHVTTAMEMLDAVETALPADVAIFAAAVADWRPAAAPDRKLKKEAGEGGRLELVENPDILATIAAAGADRPRLVIGFAAETDDVIAHARAKRRRKGCEWILANDVGPGTGTFGGKSNTIHLVTADDSVDSWPAMSKEAVGEELARRIAAELGA